jgi:hypothetical protein
LEEKTMTEITSISEALEILEKARQQYGGWSQAELEEPN